MRAVALAAAATAVVAAATWWRTMPPTAGSAADGAAAARVVSGPEPRRVNGPDAERRAAIEAALRAAGASEPRYWERPGSLAGTEPDGAFAADADGNLIVSPELRRAFEYWFAATGEEPEARIRARIAAEIRAHLPEPARAAALALVARFITYRERARDLAADAPEDLAARAAAVHDLRREVFGADADALFSDEEALTAFALAERRIAADPALTDDQRAAQLDQLLAAAPEPIRAARAAATAPLRLARDEAALRAAGGTAEDVRRLREERVGPEAADRLAALDDARAAWRARVDSYRAARATIDADAALDVAARAEAIAALRGRYFSGPELLRIEALDRLAGASQPTAVE
jgi:lipase chaperone LimK